MIQKRRTQVERRLESEHALLEAAAEIIIEEGYGAATFGRIGERAGYAASLVTSRFGSKDGLFHAIIDFLSDRYESYFEQNASKFANGRERMAGMTETFLAHLEHDRLGRAYYILLATAIGNNLPQKTYFMARHNVVRRRVAKLIREGLNDGSIGDGADPEMLAVAIGCLHLGIAMQVQLDPATRTDTLRPLIRAFQAGI